MELMLWTCCCGAVAVELEQKLERPRDPHAHDQVRSLLFFVFSFVFLLFEEASKLRSFSGAPEAPCCNAASSGELLSLLLGQQAPESS